MDSGRGDHASRSLLMERTYIAISRDCRSNFMLAFSVNLFDIAKPIFYLFQIILGINLPSKTSQKSLTENQAWLFIFNL